MKDINFFEAYKYQKEKKRKKSELLPKIILGIIVLLILGAQGYVYWSISTAEKDIAKIDKDLQDKEFVVEYNQSKKAESKILETDKKIKKAEVKLNEIKKKFNVSSDDIITLLDGIPEETFLQEIQAVDKKIEIKAITSKYDAVAQYLYNIKNARDDLSGAFVSEVEELNIDEDSNASDYEYTITVSLEEESDDKDNR